MHIRLKNCIYLFKTLSIMKRRGIDTKRCGSDTKQRESDKKQWESDTKQRESDTKQRDSFVSLFRNRVSIIKAKNT